jgi:hypothetical protein
MNKDKQRMLIAEACVKTMNCCRCQKQAHVFKYSAPFCSEECAERCGEFQLDDGQLSVPDYPNDLNAMHEAEKVLKNNKDQRGWESYILAQDELLGSGDKIHATAAQRAEAFLKIIGKWKNE